MIVINDSIIQPFQDTRTRTAVDSNAENVRVQRNSTRAPRARLSVRTPSPSHHRHPYLVVEADDLPAPMQLSLQDALRALLRGLHTLCEVVALSIARSPSAGGSPLPV